MSNKNDEEQVLGDIQKVDRVTAQTLDESGKVDAREIHLSTGVVLLAKAANPNMLIRAMSANPRPKPPIVMMPQMGREMENPDDPDYISRVQAWQSEYSAHMLNVLIGLGTELKSVPKGFEGPHPKGEKQPEWIKEYVTLGFQAIPDSPTWRYITWVLFRAAVTQEDTKLIGDKVRVLSGIKEADVRDAENFPAGN